jgi:queuosine biosynthesis protein QueC
LNPLSRGHFDAECDKRTGPLLVRSLRPPSGAAMNETHALVLFSGGQDSTTCLAWALARYSSVETIGFDYGQRHRVEMQARLAVIGALRQDFPDWAQKLGIDHVLELAALAEVSETSLTRDVAISMAADGLPNSFVPGRNLLFLTFAAALAYRRGIKHLVIGVCETDYSGYPDCRDDTIKAIGCAQPRHGDALRRTHAADVHRQGRDMGAGARARRPGADRGDRRAQPHLLQRRPFDASRLGLWLREMPGLRSTRGRLAPVRRATRLRRR